MHASFCFSLGTLHEIVGIEEEVDKKKNTVGTCRNADYRKTYIQMYAHQTQQMYCQSTAQPFW